MEPFWAFFATATTKYTLKSSFWVSKRCFLTKSTHALQASAKTAQENKKMKKHDVENYVKTGPPFAGDSEFKHRAEIKAAGGEWHGSEKKWVAKSHQAFVAMVETNHWTPIGCPVGVQCVVDFMRAQMRKARDKDMQSRIVNKAASLTPEEQEKERRDKNGISQDTTEQLEKLALDGITPTMIRAANQNHGLGPYCGQSDAFRVLRGLHYGILTVQDVIKGNIAISDSKKKRPNAARHQNVTATVDQKLHVHEDEEDNATTRQRRVWEQHGYKPPKRITAHTYCTTCMYLVLDQFMDCACEEVSWNACGVCGYKWSPVQPCKCSSTREFQGTLESRPKLKFKVPKK
jgi:hypothetical protein